MLHGWGPNSKSQSPCFCFFASHFWWTGGILEDHGVLQGEESVRNTVVLIPLSHLLKNSSNACLLCRSQLWPCVPEEIAQKIKPKQHSKLDFFCVRVNSMEPVHKAAVPCRTWSWKDAINAGAFVTDPFLPMAQRSLSPKSVPLKVSHDSRISHAFPTYPTFWFPPWKAKGFLNQPTLNSQKNAVDPNFPSAFLFPRSTLQKRALQIAQPFGKKFLS